MFRGPHRVEITGPARCDSHARGVGAAEQMATRPPMPSQTCAAGDILQLGVWVFLIGSAYSSL